MTKTLIFPNWKEKVVYPAKGAQPQVLAENEKFKAVVGGLEAGQKIPSHPGSPAIYIILEGSGIMTVDDEQIQVEAGTTIIAEEGASRGFDAQTRLAFIAVKIN